MRCMIEVSLMVSTDVLLLHQFIFCELLVESCPIPSPNVTLSH